MAFFSFNLHLAHVCPLQVHILNIIAGEHILSDAKSALRENAKMQTRADEPLKVRLRRAIFTCLYLFCLGTT